MGSGCDALADDSALIKRLQQQSAAKKDQYAKESLERYNRNNYGDYFAAEFPPRKLVRHSNGTFEALTDQQIGQGVKAGKIGLGYSGTGWQNYQDRNPYFFIEDLE